MTGLKKLLFYRPGFKRQFPISVVLILAVSLIGLSLHDIIGYKPVAFMLLVAVSILAMFLDIVPVLIVALLSALIWDFFFTPPGFTLTVGMPEDRFLLVVYFIVAMINAVLTNKIRQMEKEVKSKDEKAKSVKFCTTLFNSLSHKLRTPITTIIGSIDNLQTNSPRLSENDKSDLLSEILVASIRLNQQAENLLNMSRLEAGVLHIKKDWCDINDRVYKSLQRLESNLQKYKVVVEIPEDLPLFKLGFGLMEQVLYSLILNVTQHTSSFPEKDLIKPSISFTGQKAPCLGHWPWPFHCERLC